MKGRKAKEMSIKRFTSSLLQLLGAKRGSDFQVYNDHLYILKHPNRGKVLSTLRELYPEYNFYWESPRVLKWF